MMLSKKGRNEELRICYMNSILGNEIKAYEAVGHVPYMGEEGNAYRGLVGKPEGRTWDDINKMDLKKYILGWRGLGLSGSEKRQDEGIFEYGNEPSYSTKCGEFLD